MTKDKLYRRNKRKLRVRSKTFGTKALPRLSVYRSNKNIYAQIINDSEGRTLAAASDRDVEPLKANKKSTKNYSKIDKAYLVGEILAKKAKRKKVTKVVFDRGGYKYHGRVKALAEGARRGGLKF